MLLISFAGVGVVLFGCSGRKKAGTGCSVRVVCTCAGPAAGGYDASRRAACGC